MSYESRTLADQRPAFAVLTEIGRAFGHLPAAEFNISRIYLNQVAISVHEDLGDFETWRVALGIPASGVAYKAYREFASLTAVAEWGGGEVELVGYGPLPKYGGEES